MIISSSQNWNELKIYAGISLFYWLKAPRTARVLWEILIGIWYRWVQLELVSFKNNWMIFELTKDNLPPHKKKKLESIWNMKSFWMSKAVGLSLVIYKQEGT